MIEIFLDTNIIINEGFFRFPFIDGALKRICFLGNKVLIPEIVIDETKGNFALHLAKQLKEHKQTHKKLGKLINVDNLDIILDDEINNYNSFLDRFLNRDGIEILAYPENSIKEIVTKSYEAKKPFNSDNKGYKDYVIWQTIKKYCEDNRGIAERFFITDNKKDFCKTVDGISTLHPDLVASFDNIRGVPEVILSFRDFFDMKINPSLTTVNSKDIPPLNIKEIIENIFLNDLLDYTADGFLGLPFGCEVIISSILDEPYIDKISFSELNANDILIDINGTAYIEVDGFMDKSEYYSSEDETIYVEEADYNDHVMRVSQCIETSFDLTIMYSKKYDRILDHKLNLPDEINYDDH